MSEVFNIADRMTRLEIADMHAKAALELAHGGTESMHLIFKLVEIQNVSILALNERLKLVEKKLAEARL